MTTIPDTHTDILTKHGVAHVATTGPDGEPQNTPVWFDWDGSQLRISLTKDRQKFKNLTRDHRIAVSLVDPDNPMHSLEVRGTASWATDDDRSFINGLAKRYLGLDEYPLPEPGAVRMIVTIEPERTTTFL